MTQTEPTRDDVLAAADAIVDAFAATDGDRYFRAFAPDATFLFHTEAARLDDRAAYERLWREWTQSGWRVVSCDSSDRLVQTFPGGAVFTHTVDTTADSGEERESYRERETIVFRVADTDTGIGVGVGVGDTDAGAGLVAVHEHLSPLPESSDAPAS